MLTRALQLCDELRDFDPALLSGDDCARVVEVLARTEKACAAARARAALRAAEAGAHGGKGLADADRWLAQRAGMSRAQAADELATAAALTSCVATRDALVRGDVSLAQAREIVRAESVRPGSQEELLAVAKRESLAVLKEQARSIRLHAVDREALHARQREARSVRHWRDELGMSCGTWRLPPEVGVPFANRLDAATDREFRAARRAGRCEPRDRYAADAFTRLFAGGGGGRGARGEGGGGAGDAGDGGGGGGGRRERSNVEMVVVCDINALRRGRVEGEEPCHIVGGGPIPVSIARELAEDAFLKGVLHDGVNIHTVKHYGRFIKTELRTALNLGSPPAFDGRRCRKCGGRFRLQIDHINPVANGGPTCHSNLEDLCDHCHPEKTERDREAGLLGQTGKRRRKVRVRRRE